MAACIALALLATPASATLSYPSPQTLSDAGQDSERSQVAIDGSDRATIIWSRLARIQSVRLAADGTPEAVQTLSGGGAFAPRVVVDGSDRATIIWGRGDGSNYRIQSVRLAADGTPEAVQTLSEAGQDSRGPEVAIDGSGRATIVWWRFDGANDRIQSVRLAADGTPGPVQTLSEAGQDAISPRVAIDGSGRATIAWQRSDGTNSRVQSVRLASDGTPGPVQTLSGAGQDAGDPQVAIDGSDRARVVWVRSDGANYRIQSVRLAADGTPGPVLTLSAAGQHAVTSQVAIDGSDRATIVWWRGPRIQSVRLAADGTPGPVQTLSEAGQYAAFPEVAIDGSDRATITWYRSDGTNSRIQAVRLAADGTPGPVQTLSDAGQSALFPEVAIDGSDRPTITSYRSDGTNNRIQSVRAEITNPETTITSGPFGPTKNASPSFAFTDEAAGTTFECSLDSEPFSPCSSPKSYSKLPEGRHSFEVRASDSDGTDPTPAERGFTVDTKLEGSATAKSTQKQQGKKIKVKVRVKAGEKLTAKATGKIKVGRKSYKLKPQIKSLGSGQSKGLKLKPKKSKDAKRIIKDLKQGKAAKAKLTLKLTDRAGNGKSKQLPVKLRR